MNTLKELIGLFIEDGSLAIAILLWVGLMKLLLMAKQLNPAACSILFLFGLIILLIENVLRSAKAIRLMQRNEEKANNQNM